MNTKSKTAGPKQPKLYNSNTHCRQGGIQKSVMAAALPLSDDTRHDKITEKRLVELIGTTAKALQRKRERNVIPLGVWSKIDGRIMYSKWRYDEWLESQWGYPQGLSSSGSRSESGSPGTRSGAAKPSPSRRPPRESRQQRVYVLK